MIGLDTHVLVRYIAQDDPEQSALATALIESLTEEDRGFISTVALVELHWVLRSAYKVSRTDTAAIIGKLLVSQELSLQEPDLIRRALSQLRDDLDFSDALISEAGQAAGCTHTATFDRRAAGLKDMTLLPPGAAP